ncbi:NAD-binding protein, partial [Oharaeibacter diazotrophicus]
AERWFAPVEPPDAPPSPPQPAGGHTLVVGHGRVGRVVCSLLAAHGRPHLVVDSDALAVARDRLAGHDVHYGDAATPAFLISCGIADAAAVVVTVHEPAVIDAVVGWVRVLAPEVPVFARARDGAHARHLYGVGVTDAVPETVEASLQLSETVLVGLGVPMGPVIASIHDKRDEFRRDLREAARRRTDPPPPPPAAGGRDAAA